MKELRLGSITLDNPFFLAPLAGITDATMRKLCKEMGAALVFSEMVSAKGMWYGDKNTGRLLYTRKEEAPFGVQIFGHEPDIMAYAARQIRYHVMGYYPITPSTQIAEQLDVWRAEGSCDIAMIPAETRPAYLI